MKILKFNFVLIFIICISFIGCNKDDEPAQNTLTKDKPVITLDQKIIDFGIVESNTGEKEVVITATNNSKVAINDLSTEVSTTSFQGTVSVKTESTKIAPGKSIKVYVSYKAGNTKLGEYKGGTITLKPSVGKPVVIPLLVKVTENGKQLISLDTDKIDFGKVEANTGEKEIIITVTNKSKVAIDGFGTETNTTSFQGEVNVKTESTKIDSGKSIKIYVTYKAGNANPGEYKDGTITLKPSIGIPVVVPLSVNVVESRKRNLTLNIAGLKDLGKDYVYEGWIIVDDKPVSTGTFTSVTFPQKFEVDELKLKKATKFTLTIEPKIDLEPDTPSETKVLAGDFYGNSAEINSNIIADFSSASGRYYLAVHTGGIPLPDYIDLNSTSGIDYRDRLPNPTPSGIWFGSLRNPLNLPKLPKGWKYEGWVVLKGRSFSTGTFDAMRGYDDNYKSGMYRYFIHRSPVYHGAPKREIKHGPRLPGEDFTKNAPEGYIFPTDLRGNRTFISVEPYPDNDITKPFIIKPLAHKIPTNAEPSKIITMDIGPVTKIVGTVSR